MNEILLPAILLGIGAFFSLLTALMSGLLLHALRGQRDRLNSVEAKTNENAEAIARLEGRFGLLGTHQNWRE
jgi:hypothetical protein